MSSNQRFLASEPSTKQPFYNDLHFAVKSFDALESSYCPINPWLLIAEVVDDAVRGEA